MYFEKPGLLWALFALLLPILYHLFSLRPSRRVWFSHLPLLRAVLSRSQTHHRLHKRLLLLLRLLCLLFLVLAFAQPYFSTQGTRFTHTHVVMYVDNSLSMSVAHESTGRPAFEQAIDYARRIVQRYGDETQVAIMTNDNATGVYESQKEALRRLSSLRYSAYRLGSDEVQARLAPLLIQKREAVSIYWLSDMQANVFTNVHRSGRAFWADSVHDWRFIPFRLRSTSNLHIDTVYSSSLLWTAGEPNALCARVRRTGEAKEENVTMTFFVEGRQEALRAFSLPSSQSEVLCFDYTPSLSASQSLSFSLDVDDTDARFDNAHYLSLQRSEKLRILEVASSRSSNVIKRVYGNKARFIYRSHRFSQPFEGDLADYDLVILHALPVLSPWWLSRVSEYKKAGGRVLIIPPAQGNTRGYATLLEGWQKIEGQKRYSLQGIDYSLPFFSSVFREKRPHVALPSARAAYGARFRVCRCLCVWKMTGLGWFARRQGQGRQGFAMRFFLLCAGRIRIWCIIRCLFR